MSGGNGATGGYFWSAAKAMAVTMRNVFRASLTEDFGRPSRDRGERYRNSFALLHDPATVDHEGNPMPAAEELCIACKKCQLICPSDIITVTAGDKAESLVTGKKRGYLADFTLDMNACIFCELCVQVCPVDAIIMCQEATEPAFFREDLVLTMDKLYANETAKPASWATGSKLVDMQDPDRLSPAQQAAKDAAIKAAADKIAVEKAAADNAAAEVAAEAEAAADVDTSSTEVAQ